MKFCHPGLFAAGLATFILGGCPPIQGPLGPIVTTGIPEGIYTGQSATTLTSSRNGSPLPDQSSTDPYTEVVDSNGLPLIEPDGVPPRKNVVSAIDLSGGRATVTVESVNASDNKLVISYTFTLSHGGGEVKGVQTETYTFVAPNELDYVQQLSGAGKDAGGDLITISLTSTATLKS